VFNTVAFFYDPVSKFKMAQELYEQGMLADSLGQTQKAIDCFRKVLQEKDVQEPYKTSATFNLGCKLYEIDKDEAKQFWATASNQGHPKATFYLARMYEDDNDVQAMILFLRAYDLGCPDAADWLKETFDTKTAEEARNMFPRKK
jgi:TPR repeat protein